MSVEHNYSLHDAELQVSRQHVSAPRYCAIFRLCYNVCKEDKCISLNILYIKCQTEFQILYSLVKFVIFKVNEKNDKTVKILGIKITKSVLYIGDLGSPPPPNSEVFSSRACYNLFVGWNYF